MSEHRLLPLREISRQGLFGATRENPGVMLSLVHPVSLIQVIARKSQADIVLSGLDTFKSVLVMNAGPDQWLVQATGMNDGALASAMKTKLGATASVIDQSHGRVVIEISGPKARAVLAKGTPVDFHADMFEQGQSAQTQMAHLGVHITHRAADTFYISVFRGFSESLWEWLCQAAAEFGYQVK